MRRLVTALGAVTLLALPASVALSGTANAGGFGSSIVCKKLSGSESGNVTITGSKCKAKAPKGYGNLSAPAASLNGSGVLTWTNGDTLDTTVTNIGLGSAKCPKGYTADESSVVVTGSGGDGYDAALVTGTSYDNTVCLGNTNGKITLPKGGSFTL